MAMRRAYVCFRVLFNVINAVSLYRDGRYNFRICQLAKCVFKRCWPALVSSISGLCSSVLVVPSPIP